MTLAVTEVALPADVRCHLRDRVREFHEAGDRVVASVGDAATQLETGAEFVRLQHILSGLPGPREYASRR